MFARFVSLLVVAFCGLYCVALACGDHYRRMVWGHFDVRIAHLNKTLVRNTPEVRRAA